MQARYLVDQIPWLIIKVLSLKVRCVWLESFVAVHRIGTNTPQLIPILRQLDTTQRGQREQVEGRAQFEEKERGKRQHVIRQRERFLGVERDEFCDRLQQRTIMLATTVVSMDTRGGSIPRFLQHQQQQGSYCRGQGLSSHQNHSGRYFYVLVNFFSTIVVVIPTLLPPR